MTPRLVRSMLGIALLATTAIAQTVAAGADAGTSFDHSAERVTVAVVGDVPYGISQEVTYSSLIDAINNDPKVRLAVHVGDFKSGSTPCTDERMAAVAYGFATFEDPLVYTPGDNEWTDCHRANNGAYNPLERLAALRSLFFAHVGETLGRHPKPVDHQTELVENLYWVESQVAFATLHVIGSNNGLGPWTGLGFTSPTPEQAAEVDARVGATLAWIDITFDRAETDRLDGVVLAMQADTWAPVPTSAQQAIVNRIAHRTANFEGRVLLLQGDTHRFKVDNPLGLDNFTRIVVHGETLPFEYLRLTIDHRDDDLFSWERVQVEP